MRHFDFAPLYRSTIGFDRFAQLLDNVGGVEGDTTYPPYNIERLGDNQYRITMAVAGFSEPEIKIEVKETALLVKGEKKPEFRSAISFIAASQLAALSDGSSSPTMLR